MTQWQDDMYTALRYIAVHKPTFTNDDVFEFYDKWKLPSDVQPDDKREYGSVVNKAIRDELIEWTGHTVVTRRKNCHKMLIRVWKSKIYQATKQSTWEAVKTWIRNNV